MLIYLPPYCFVNQNKPLEWYIYHYEKDMLSTQLNYHFLEIQEYTNLFRTAVKIWDDSLCTQIIIKNFWLFFSSSIRMSGKNMNFGDKKIKKSNFYKNKKVIRINNIDVNKIFFLKKNHMVQKIHLNTLLDTMIMMLLDHYP